MTVIDTRVISGQGILKCPYSNPDIKKAKVLTFFFDLIRPPSLFYSNKHYNPNRALYAYICFMRDGYVMSADRMEFPTQLFEFNADISAQAEYAIKCAYSGILQTFVNLGNALGVTPTSVTNNIKDWTHTILFPDSVLIVCEADSAVQVTCQSTPYDICPDDTSTPPPPPPPPPPPTKYPAGHKFDNPSTSPISPPYTPPNDGGDTIPFGGDTTHQDGPTPPPNPTQRYNVTVLWYINGDHTNGRTSSAYIYGQASDVRDYWDGSQDHLQVYCYGLYPSTPLTSPDWIDIVGPSGIQGHYADPSIQSITPI